MIRGRHRGLPYKLDRAIVLPGERLEEDHSERDKVQTKFDWRKLHEPCSQISVRQCYARIFLLLYKDLGTDKELEVGFISDEDTTRSSVNAVFSRLYYRIRSIKAKKRKRKVWVNVPIKKIERIPIMIQMSASISARE